MIKAWTNWIKIKKAQKASYLKMYPVTFDRLLNRLPENLIREITAKQLAVVIDSLHAAYQDGRTSTGAEMIDRNAVWIASKQKIVELN